MFKVNARSKILKKIAGLVILAQLIFTFSYAEDGCFKFLKTEDFKTPVFKSMQRLAKLDPDFYQHLLLDQNLDHEKIYLALKVKAWKIMPFGMIDWKSDFAISEDLKQLWVYSFGAIFKIEELSPKNLVIFYANNLQSIYSQTLGQILKERALVLEQKFGLTDKEFKKRLIYVLGQLLGYDLRRSHIDPETAAKALASDQYLKIDWSAVYRAYLNFKSKINSDTQQKFSASDLLDLKKSTSLGDLEIQVLELLFADQTPRPSDELCCKNTAGCIFCPNNLGFRK